MTPPLTVDPKVHELAVWWLSNDDTASAKDRKPHDARVMSLASDIQRAIEDWCNDEAMYDEEQAAAAEEARSLKGYSDAERERI